MASTAGKTLAWLVLLIVLALLGLAGFAWSGIYDVSADAPHTRPVHAVLQTVRERSIAVRADDLPVPDLADRALITQGSGNYDAMCVTCHRAPGMDETELSRGLYPAPPNLAQHDVDPAKAFWVIKHGIKSTGMPAWGESMDDAHIWNLVAFLQVLPGLDTAAYQALVASSGGHSHGGGEAMGNHQEPGAQDHHAPAGDAPAMDAGHAHSPGTTADAAPAASVDVPPDAVGAVAAVDAFGKALAAGDMAAVESALAPGVIVLESGGAERSRSEYMGHHAKADSTFLGKAHAVLTRRTARIHGDLAWVASESELHSTHGSRPSTTLSTETMVLERTGEGWQIVHIHWSSQPKK